VFYAELNELLTRELAEDGYSGVEVRVTPMRTEIIIRATRTQNVLGEQLDGASEACATATAAK
jgi:small subunit ribosomal protein S3e